jgi:mevalonate kinase
MADAREFRESAQEWIDKINSDLLRAYLEAHSKEEAEEVLQELRNHQARLQEADLSDDEAATMSSDLAGLYYKMFNTLKAKGRIREI